jgi:hypothetical protein
MSYVLDALKKAERERRRQPELGLDNLEQEDWVRPSSSERQPRSTKLLWLAALILCLSVGFLTLKFTLSSVDNQELPLSAISPPQNIDFASEPEVIQILVEEKIEPSEPEIPEVFDLEVLVDGLRIEGSMYLEGNPQASRVFIEGQAYFVGDQLKNDVYIKDITPDSVVLSNGYDEVIRNLR